MWSLSVSPKDHAEFHPLMRISMRYSVPDSFVLNKYGTLSGHTHSAKALLHPTVGFVGKSYSPPWLEGFDRYGRPIKKVEDGDITSAKGLQKSQSVPNL
jgi:hypothetical protein